MLLGFVSERESDYARLARFLHDEVGQVLSAVGLQLDALRHDFSSQMPELDQRAVDIQRAGVFGGAARRYCFGRAST